MELTNNQKRLIKAVSNNDLISAKKYALACVKEDSSPKNFVFCNTYKSKLNSSKSNLIDLPNDLKHILYVEDVSNTFREKRYYLSDREKAVFENIIRMKKTNSKLMQMGIPYLNSTLLFGAPGTGKSLFGKFVAYKTGLPFCYLNFSNLVDYFMGKTSKNISKAFEYVISHPCVFMLDEIDCISIRRSDSSSSSGAGGEMARITISLMQEFDKLPNNIIIIGATNRIDRIDEALLRRFSLKHEVESFNRNEKKQMLLQYIDDIGIKFTEEELNELITEDDNQSIILNNLIRKIAAKIEATNSQLVAR